MRKSVFGRFWARFFSAILHIYFRIRRGTTLGVRAVVRSPTSEFLLVRHTYTPGWHFPGGIIRFRETMLDRVKMVAKSELGVKVINIKGPQKISEVISHDIKERSHFISFLFECELDNFYFDKIKGLIKKQPGKLSFFNKAPKDLLKNHLIYLEFFN